MAAGSVIVDLLLRTGSFETDTKRAEKRLREFEKAASEVGKRIALGTTAIGGFAVALFKSSNDAIDAFNDLSDATGASIENISALDRIARETGGSFDQVAGALVKFNQVLGSTDEEGGRASEILRAMGLNARELKQIDPAEALRQTAVALSKFADDGDKARAVQVLFGKSIREVAPFLKDLAEQGKLTASVTTEGAQQAEQFAKSMARLQATATDLARALTLNLLPSINSTLEGFQEIKKLGSLDLVLKDAAKGFFGMQSDLAGNIGQNINRLIAERDKLRQATAPDPTFAESFKRQTEDRIGEINRLLEILRGKQSRANLEGLGDVSDAVSRRMGGKPSLNIPTIGGGGGRAVRAPVADRAFNFTSYNDQITQAVSALLEGSEVTKAKVFGDTLARLDELFFNAGISAELYDSAVKKLFGTQDNAKTGTDEFAESQRRLAELLGNTASAKLEEQRSDMLLLAKAFEDGKISVDLFNEAVAARLGQLTEPLEKVKGLSSEIGLSFSSALEDAIVGGKGLRSVLGGLEQDLLRIFTRKLVTEPFADLAGNLFNDLFKPSGGGAGVFGSLFSGGGGSGLLGGLFGGGGGSGASLGLDSIFGGFFAEGGRPPVGKVSVVGERGPELFIPNTAGRILPNDALTAKTTVNKPMTQVLNFNVQGQIDRRSQEQIAREAGLAVQRSMRRNT